MKALEHGGRLDEAIARYGGQREDWLDLSTGINPHTYPVPELDHAVWHRLPEREQENKLLKIARRSYGVREDMGLVAVNGTQAIIERLPELFGTSTVCIVTPTYGEHAHAWKRAGHRVKLVATVDHIEAGSIGVLVNPNNPDGRVVEPSRLVEVAGRLKALIVDEAFCDTVPESSCVPTMPDNVVVLRSFGKFYGLAGLRLGFAICNTDLAHSLHQAIGPWAISGPAIAVGAKALADEAWAIAMRHSLRQASDRLAAGLGRCDIEVVGRNALFVYGRHAKADELFEHLAQNQVLARKFSEREGFLRFGLCKNNDDFERLFSVLGSKP